MKTRTLTIENLPDSLPDDVLVEHVGYAIRKLCKERPVETPPEPNVKLAGGSLTTPTTPYVPIAPSYPWQVPTQRYPWYNVTASLGSATVSNAVNSAAAYEKAKADLEALKNLAPIVKKVEPRQHPFEGPEVFDDEGEPKPLPGIKLTEPILEQLSRAIAGDFPHLTELFRAKREDPKAEGDWQLPEDDGKVGEDL